MMKMTKKNMLDEMISAGYLEEADRKVYMRHKLADIQDTYERVYANWVASGETRSVRQMFEDECKARDLECKKCRWRYNTFYCEARFQEMGWEAFCEYFDAHNLFEIELEYAKTHRFVECPWWMC